MVKAICIVCDSEFKTKPSEIKKGWGKHCSKHCANITNGKRCAAKYGGFHGENNPAWKGGADTQKAKMRRNESAKKWKADNKETVRAQAKTQTAIKYGRLKKMPCEACGEKNAEAHHCDYNEPMEVMWLCRRHHSEWHTNNKPIYVSKSGHHQH